MNRVRMISDGFKAIVMDIDGTLLNEEKIISTRTKDKLIEA